MTPEITAATVDDRVAPLRVAPIHATRPTTRARIRRPAVLNPSWLTLLDSLHRGQRSKVTAAVDAAVVFGVGVLAGVPAAEAGILTAVLTVGLYVGGGTRSVAA